MLYNWYSTSFTVPSDWTGERVLLNFGAVDYEATVFVNGKKAGFNRGGYYAFTIDITDYLQDGSNELYVSTNFSITIFDANVIDFRLVFAFDPTDSDRRSTLKSPQTLPVLMLTDTSSICHSYRQANVASITYLLYSL